MSPYFHLPHMYITEFAKHLNVSNETVYNWIELSKQDIPPDGIIYEVQAFRTYIDLEKAFIWLIGSSRISSRVKQRAQKAYDEFLRERSQLKSYLGLR